MIVTRKVGWHPGDDQHDPGYAACAVLADGTLAFPMGHPATFATEAEAEAILHRIEDSPTGPVIRPHLTLVVG